MGLKIILTNQTCIAILRRVRHCQVKTGSTSNDSMVEPENMDAILRFQNGAVMHTPIERSKPVSQTFRLPSHEGDIFMFSLVDALPGGQLVYQEWPTEQYIRATK